MKIFPSILSADFSCLKSDVKPVLDAGVNRLHLDVMDGHFVPNISFGFPVIRSLSNRFPDVKLDAHLMIEEPAEYLDPLVDIGVDWVSFHAEVDPDYGPVIERLHEHDIRAGVALNPDTPVDRLDGLWDRIDFLLLMTVQPGFGGQSFRESVLEKIDRLPPGFDRPIQVDGGVGPDTIGRAARAGVDWFVSGSSVFGQDQPGKACEDLLDRAQQAQG